MITLVGFAAHWLSTLAAGVLIARGQRGRLLWPMMLCSAVVLLGVNWHTRQGYERIVILGGVLGAYLVGLRLPWRRQTLSIIGYVALALAAVRAVAGWAGVLDDPRQGANALAGVILLTSTYTDPRAVLLGLLLTQSRGAGLAAGAALIAVEWRRARPYIVPIVAASAVLVVVLIAWRPGTVEHRLQDWDAAWQLWLTSPWTGAGSGAYWSTGRGEHADSLAYTILAENGVLGILVGAVLVQQMLRTVWHGAASFGLLAYLLSEWTDATLLMPWTGLVAGLVIADLEAGYAAAGVHEEEGKRRGREAGQSVGGPVNRQPVDD